MKAPQSLRERSLYFPKTRFQGSKRKIIRDLSRAFRGCPKGTALDLYSGSGTVTLLFSQLGYRVISNDYLAFANNTSELFLYLNYDLLDRVDWQEKLKFLLHDASVEAAPVVTERFKDVFFTDDENFQIDRFCQNLRNDNSTDEARILIYAVGQALLMKRPYNLFHRANLYMRLENVKRSFGNHVTWNKPIEVHALKAIQELKRITPCPVVEGHEVTTINTAQLEGLHCDPDLVYLDPPYIPARTTPIDYADFYHFLEGLVDYSLFSATARKAKHIPIVNHQTRWLEPSDAIIELQEISDTWPEAAIVMSYRDDGKPTVDEILEILSNSNRHASVFDTKKYKYALSHSKTTHEIIIIAN